MISFSRQPIPIWDYHYADGLIVTHQGQMRSSGVIRGHSRLFKMCQF